MMKLAPLLAAFPLLAGCTIHSYPADPAAPPPPPPSYGPADDPSYRPSAPATGGWELLGRLTVDGRNDRDSLPVGRRQGRFAKLQLRVTNSSMKMHDVVVVFTDGTRYSPNTRLVFNRGAVSNVIDLPGTRRTIQRIDFRYSDMAGGGRANVEVWAR